MPRNHIKAGGDRTLFCLGKNSKSLFLWTSKFHYLKCPLSTWWILYSFFSPKSHITSSAKCPLTLQVAIIAHSLCNLCMLFLLCIHHTSLSFVYLSSWTWLDDMFCQCRDYVLFLSEPSACVTMNSTQKISSSGQIIYCILQTMCLIKEAYVGGWWEKGIKYWIKVLWVRTGSKVVQELATDDSKGYYCIRCINFTIRTTRLFTGECE